MNKWFEYAASVLHAILRDTIYMKSINKNKRIGYKKKTAKERLCKGSVFIRCHSNYRMAPRFFHSFLVMPVLITDLKHKIQQKNLPRCSIILVRSNFKIFSKLFGFYVLLGFKRCGNLLWRIHAVSVFRPLFLINLQACAFSFAFMS